MLSDKDYYICLGEMDLKLRDKIQKDLSEKFGYTDNILNQLNWKISNKSNDLFLYSNLKKVYVC